LLFLHWLRDNPHKSWRALFDRTLDFWFNSYTNRERKLMFVVGKLNFLVFYEVLGSLRSGFETFLTYLSLAGIGGRDIPKMQEMRITPLYIEKLRKTTRNRGCPRRNKHQIHLNHGLERHGETMRRIFPSCRTPTTLNIPLPYREQHLPSIFQVSKSPRFVQAIKIVLQRKWIYSPHVRTFEQETLI